MTEDEKNHREFISAAAAVYAWMSAADGEVTKSEVSGFVEYLCSLEYVNEISDSEEKEIILKFIKGSNRGLIHGYNKKNKTDENIF